MRRWRLTSPRPAGIDRRAPGRLWIAALISLLAAPTGSLISSAPAAAVEIPSAWYSENAQPITSATSVFLSTAPTPEAPAACISVDGAAQYACLAGADGTQLTVGSFAAVSPVTAGAPFVSHSGLTCPFRDVAANIIEITYAGDGSIETLAADFNSTCAMGDVGKAAAAIRFHSAIPVRALTVAPTDLDF